jgi:Cof subfamily protein (haloacid dehalogenase superfamily)
MIAPGHISAVRLHCGTGVRPRPGILFEITQERRSPSSRNRAHLGPDSPGSEITVELRITVELTMAIRLVGIDIDGTLLDSTFQIPDANLRAITNAVERGIEVALVTGRRFDFALPVARQIDCALTMMVNNGALVKSKQGETFVRTLLGREIARNILGAMQDQRNTTTVLFDRPRENQIMFETLDWEHPSRKGYWERNRAYIGEVTPLESCLVEDPIQVMFTGQVALMRQVAARLSKLDCRHQFSIALTEYESRDFSLVDVLHADVTKGKTLEQWAKRQGYARESVMAIGDNLNDREMLEYAGRPVVMGNAVQELKNNGWAVTGSNDQAGVAMAIEKYALDPG